MRDVPNKTEVQVTVLGDLRPAICLPPGLRFMGRIRICKLVLGTESPSGTNTLADELEFLSSSFVCVSLVPCAGQLLANSNLHGQ